jgi:LEA14-like dessication related protein
MKRALSFILVSFAACAAAAAIDFPKPTAEITRFQIEAITLRDVTFLFELTVKNPYPVNLKFAGVDMDFSVEGNKVFHAASQGGFTVKAKDKKANTFTVALSYEAIIKLVKDYASKDWLNTRIDGTLVIPLPKLAGLPKDISFKYKLDKKIPAIKPRVSVVAFAVKPPTSAQVRDALAKAGSKVPPEQALGALKDLIAGKKPEKPVVDPAELDVPLTVSFTLEVKNDARGPIDFKALDYELLVNGDSLVAGASSSVAAEAGRTLVTVTNVFSAKRLTKNVKTLFAERKGSFQIKGKSTLKLPDEIRKEPIPLSFDEAGAFDL